MQFVDRDRELGLLNELYGREGAQLVVLYGRRRVGKTRLLTHWLAQLAERPGARGGPAPLYWMATQTSATNQLRAFSQAVFAGLHPGEPVEPTFRYASWEAAFQALGRAAAAARRVVVLDEFTYVMQADPEVPSLLQRAWDHQLQNRSQLFLVLSGSLAGMIQRYVLDYQAPLYGRATARLRLGPLPFGALAALLPRYRPEQRVAVYAITGGVPAYLELFDDRESLPANLRAHVVTPANVMLGDAAFLLHEQLDQPRNYMAILEAIGAGHHRLSEVARMAGIERSNIVKYLGVLQDLGYVARRVPATVRRPERSRKGRYVIADPYLRFYYRFLAPNLSFIERGMVGQAVGLIADHLQDFIGAHTFEELCREWVAVQADRGALPFLPERVGSFWSTQAQVDVVAVNWRTRNLLLGECKWRARPLGRNVVRALAARTEQVVPKGDWQLHYACFARQGFTAPAQAAAEEIGADLVDLGRLEADLRAWLAGGR